MLAPQRDVPLKLIANRLGNADTNPESDSCTHVTDGGSCVVIETVRSVSNP
jgi:hypothetical protein